MDLPEEVGGRVVGVVREGADQLLQAGQDRAGEDGYAAGVPGGEPVEVVGKFAGGLEECCWHWELEGDDDGEGLVGAPDVLGTVGETFLGLLV